MSERTSGILEMTFAMSLIGTLGIFVVFSGESPINVAFWRCMFGAIGLTAICAFKGAFAYKISLNQFLLAMLGGIALTTNWVMLFYAIGHASISLTTAIYNTQPFMLVCFGALFFGEQLTLRKLCWLAIAFCGVVLIAQSKPELAYAEGSFAVGVALSIGAAFLWAVAVVATKKLSDVPPHLIALIQVSTGALMLTPLASFSDLPTETSAWASLLTLGFVHTAMMYTILYSAVQKLPTHLQGALTFLYPSVAYATDYLILGQKFGPIQILGIAVIMLAAAGMTLGWRLPFSRRTSPFSHGKI
ncbi:DMT family transporter [Labrenzia sp. PHM005]|uniref:DMT family transporter n=1 Tax=Labrenzia sp. PHM005 TaxID=2590016 RepID=UPI00114000F3|nr:DMT family transporter [Labrenzia sp. PHM005]QDG77041.1 DMT family transporter [Labrenzia sp. PHM005]